MDRKGAQMKTGVEAAEALRKRMLAEQIETAKFAIAQIDEQILALHERRSWHAHFLALAAEKEKEQTDG